MPGISPEAVFTEAQDAVARQDWEGFFSCLDRGDLLRIAENSMNMLLNAAALRPDLDVTEMQIALPDALVQQLREQGQAVTASAQASLGVTEPAARGLASTQHRQLVLEYNRMVKEALKSVPELARFTAGLEKQMRMMLGGGSVSSSLLQDETLDDITVEGKRAFANRRGATWTETIGFVHKNDAWYIRLFARRPAPAADRP